MKKINNASVSHLISAAEEIVSSSFLALNSWLQLAHKIATRSLGCVTKKVLQVLYSSFLVCILFPALILAHRHSKDQIRYMCAQTENWPVLTDRRCLITPQINHTFRSSTWLVLRSIGICTCLRAWLTYEK